MKELKTQGECLYDYKYDILTYKCKKRNYQYSIEFQNFAIDIDEENFVTGIRIFDASKVFTVNKELLMHIVDGEFKATMEKNVITITIKFLGLTRNKVIPLFTKRENFTQQITTPVSSKHKIENAVIECPITV